jgi:hypothetical protein
MADAVKSHTHKDPKPLTCGLIMPISAIDGCSAEHWLEVKAIITESIDSITDPKFVIKLVSDADDIGVIQKRIVQNVYNSEIVVCDVSGKNPNVMFELGMRLAFDKPIVIVKDDKTDYSFDTGIIEHVTYPRDLRFQRIVDFKKSLITKVGSTYTASVNKPDHSPFLKNFGKFQVASLNETEVTPDKLVLSLLEDLQTQVSLLRRSIHVPTRGLLTEGEFRQVLRAVRAYLVNEKVENPASLIGNENFYSQMEIACEAPKLFENRQDFVHAVERALRTS